MREEKRTRESLPGWLDGLYDPDEMRAADRFAMEERGILELELAEKAGAGLADAGVALVPGLRLSDCPTAAIVRHMVDDEAFALYVASLKVENRISRDVA
jgi:hypothetical protein